MKPICLHFNGTTWQQVWAGQGSITFYPWEGK